MRGADGGDGRDRVIRAENGGAGGGVDVEWGEAVCFCGFDLV